jgi:outer membrane protein OmpA-like peptidoglycan-associated protein
MLARLRSFLLKTPAKVALGLVLAWLLFGWLGLGPVAKWGAEKFIAGKTGHHLALDTPEFNPLNLKLTIRNLSLTEPDGKPLVGFKELFVDFEASSLFRLAWTFDRIRLTGPEGRVALLPGGKLNWTAFLAAFKDDQEEPDQPLPRLLIRHFELKDGRVDFADRTVAPVFETGFHPLDLTLDELSTLPDDKGAYQVSARTALGGQLRWQGDVTLKPVAVTGAFSLEGIKLVQLAPYLKGRVNIAAPEGTAGISTRYRVGYDKKNLSLSLDQIGATVTGLRLAGAKATEPALALDRIAVSGGRFDLDKRAFSLAGIDLAGGKVSLVRRIDGSLDVQDWFSAAAAPVPAKADAKPAKAEAAAMSWQVDLARFSLDGIAIHVLDQTFAKPLALDVGNLKIGFKANARVGAGPVQASLTEGDVRVGKIAVASAGKTLFGLEGIALEGIQASLADRHAEVARLALANGRLTATRAANGRIALLDALAPARQTTLKTRPAPASQEPGWTWKLGRAELNGFQAALRDETMKPAVALDLDAIDASVAGLSQNLAAAVPARLGLRVRQGGVLRVEGKLVPGKGALDAQVNLSGLNLAPAQPYIGQAANVVLVSGQAGSQGRLKVADKIAYQGGFSVANLLVNEAETGNRLLAWNSLASRELSASPEAVEIGEVKVDGLGLKLVIHKDKTLNLAQLMKKPAETPAVIASEAKQSSAVPEPAGSPRHSVPRDDGTAAKPGMRFTVERVTVAANEMDFADESLALPFGTRIHALKGTINGISLVKGKAAQLELDGQVDDYGLARAVGQIDFLDPTGYTDIKVVFRNVEMARLTPYSATFAGRKIESGKLSLDLEYKIKERQLQGENQVIMNKLTLGERVESATAKNLPLDLAIAILQDSDGVIDLGLPVSGSLDDPQFSYGGIIWKAIVNVIGKIALAPFRAIGKLLGISGDKLENVAFDAGESRLLPPEKDKLKQLASALAKRPNLALTATPAWHPVADRQALKEDRVRRAVAEASGRKLAPDEDPGPVSTAQAKTQEALEKLYGERIGRDPLKALKARFAQANPEPPPTSTAGKLLSRLSGMMKAKPEPLSAEESARLKGADLHGLLYQGLLDQEAVSDPELVALAGARAEAVRQHLLAEGVPADRLTVKAVEQATGEGREVNLKLGLGVARKAAAAPAAPAP